MSSLTYRSLFICSLVSICGLFTDSQRVSAQIVPDQTTATEVNGNAIAPVGKGTVTGGNLYHSFDRFDVPTSGVTFGTGNSTVDGGKINNILNRVTGDNPSQILGTIESRTAFPNANLYLMNPNGIVFGKDAKLDIGGSFNVSTGTSLGFTGDRHFSVDKAKLDFPSGNPQNIKFGIAQPAAIINQGNLTVGAGKNITFTAGSVVNSGVLTASNGNVALTSVTGGSLVDLRSPDLVLGLSVAKNAVPTDWNGEIATLPRLAELLTGKAEQGDRVVVKPDGTLAIVVTPAVDQVPVTNGTTVISGSINTSSANADGGKVGIFGDRIALVNSQISATGINGGTVLIGGDLQGKGVVPNAQFTYFDNKSVVDVSALTNGNGGKAIVWGDISTRFLGSIVANAGNVSGDGGFVEVSGKGNLDYRGIVSTLAPNGNLGTLLLDPTDITLVATGGFFAALTAVDNFADPNGTVNTLNVGLINNALSNVVLQATNNININQPINITGSGISFTAQAGNNINVNQNISTNRGSISLLANNGATATGTGSINFPSIGAIALSTNGGNITVSGANVNAPNTVNFRTFSLSGGGNVDINATVGSINAANSTYVTGVTFGGIGNSGNVVLNAPNGNITVGDVIAGTAAPNNTGDGGNITVAALGDIQLTSADTGISEVTATGKAGIINITSTNGAITAGNVTSGVVLGSGNGNDTTLTASGAVTVLGIGTGSIGGTGTGGNLKITGGSISVNAIGAGSTGGVSGTVELNAVNDITADYILNIGASQGGDVIINSDSGTIRINSTIPTIAGIDLTPCVGSSICTSATSGTAGNITIAGNLSLTNATKFLSTGTTNGGAINLQNVNINGTQNLNLEAGTGAITLSNIGATTKLGTLTVNAGSILANQAIAANNISFTTKGIITTQLLNTSEPTIGNAGNISIQSTNGNVTLASINATSTSGNGGNVDVQSSGDFTTTGNFTADGINFFAIASNTTTGNGGNISLVSNTGGINNSSGDIQSGTNNGNAGNITIQAQNFINAAGIFATAVTSGNGGAISLNSTNGGINSSTSRIDSGATNGNAGNITIQAAGSINTAGIFATTVTSGNGGAISLNSAEGVINSSSIDSGATNGNAGNLTLNALGNFGNITVNDIGTSSSNGIGGLITFQSGGDILFNRISSRNRSDTGTSGNIDIQAVGNIISTGSINIGGQDFSIISANSGTGNGGNISLVGNRIQTSPANISSSAIVGNAGNITIKAANFIITAGIFATTATSGNGGAISLNSTNGGITTSSTSRIDSGATNGNAGSLTLNALGDIEVNDIGSSTTNGIAGLVTFQSGGDILFNSISSRILSGNGTSGNIDIQAVGNITSTGSININGQDFAIISANSGIGNAGNISLISDSINTSSSNVDSSAIVGNAGNITFQATNSLVTEDLLANTTSKGNGGTISFLQTGANGIVGGQINTSAVNGSGANVTIQTDGNINLSNISTNNQILLQGTNIDNLNAGDVSLTSRLGNITVGTINTSTKGVDTTRSSEIIGLVPLSGKAGNINFQAFGDINVGGLIADSFSSRYSFPKTIQVTTQQGDPPVDVIVDQVIEVFQDYYFASAGDIELISTNGSLRSSSIIGNQLTIEVANSIDTGLILVNSDLTLQAPNFIKTLDIFSGNTSIISLNGSISTGFLNVGNLTIESFDSINLSGISISGFSSIGNNISLISNNGNVTTDYIDGSNNFGTKFGALFDGVNLTIQAKGDIRTIGSRTLNGVDYAIATFTDSGNGGNISLISETGAIDVSSGRVNTASTLGTSGNITFQAFGDIITGAGTTPNPAIASFISAGGTGTPNSITFTSSNGAINTSAGDIDAGGGAINFTARNNIITSGVFSRATNGGTIKLESQSGEINSTAGDLTTTTVTNGTGGTINLIASGNITTRGVFANGNNGNITIQSNSGGINTSLNDLASTGSNTNIRLTAPQDIVARSIFAQGDGSNIFIDSTSGNVDLSSGFIQTGIAASQTGNGGLLTIQAAGDISTGTINTPNLSSSFSGNAGSVLLTSSSGKVQFAGISARRSGGGGNGGNITVQSRGDIISTGVLSFGNVTLSNASIFPNTQPINISLTSNTGKIDLSSGAIGGLDSSFQSFIPSGTITLRSASDIILGDINGATAFGAGSISLTTTGSGAKITTGNISLNTQSIDPGRVTLITSGDITTKNINTSSLFANGNSISLTSRTGAVTTGNLTTSGSNNGANVVVIAETAITTGAIATQGLTGRGGNVILDPVGNITFTSINSTGNITLGGGGNVNIVSTGGNVLGTGVVTFATGNPCAGATICTNGTGTVSIQHGISSVFDLNAFQVNSPDPINGTRGTIITGAGSLLAFTGIPNGAGAFTQGNISITPGQGVFIPPVVPPVTPPIVPPTTSPSSPSNPDSNQTITPINPIIVTSISPVVINSTDFPFLDISKISNAKAGEYLALGNFEEAFNEIERGHLSAYENYLGETLTPQIKNIEQLQQELDEVSQLSGSATTVVYPIILDDRLELMIIPPKGMGKPFREFVTEAQESKIVPVILDFANNIRDYSSQDYLEQSQQLYNWLVRPYRDRLQTLQDKFQPANTQANPKQLAETEKQPKEKLPPTLVFVMDGGLRVIPVAALHDGKQFLIEKYALANLPYLRVSRLENRDRNINSILAMGLTEEMQGFSALPSVKIEVSTISSQALRSSSYLDQEFTVSNLQNKRRQGNFAVLHLATHAQFTSNDSKGAFIQFWNERLPIDRIPSLRFDSPLVEMLTLSACQTAVGQNLGLGGLAISSGAKSVLASLWEVSDSGTAPLMIQFYNSFPENITKAIALQRAQIDMLSGKVRIENGNILGIPKLPAIPVSTLNSSEINLNHPFFWSSFILIGNWL